MKQFCKPALMAGVVALMSGGGVYANNNPLANIRAERFDVQSGSIKTEDCAEGGRDICFIHDGDFAVYKGYDFDSGVAAFKGRVSSKNSGSIEIHLDKPTGALLGKCVFESTGGWQDWRDVTCKVDNSQAGIRDIYLIFRGRSKKALVNLSSFVFLKSIVPDSDLKPESLFRRVDAADEEPQGRTAWGMPEAGFTNAIGDGCGPRWYMQGMRVITNSADKTVSLRSIGTNLDLALTPEAYINKTDIGGEWRTLAEASLTAEISLESTNARPGIGFVSGDAKQGIYVVLNVSENAIEVWRKLSEDSLKEVKRLSGGFFSALENRDFPTGAKCRLTINWSPYSGGLMVVLQDRKLNVLANFRTAIDLPTARHPLLICAGGEAQFDGICFDPTLDGWNFKWEWRKTPVLTPDVCNPAVWKWKDGRYYMIWRKFGQDTYHGLASSADGVHWDRISDSILKCTGDMNVLVDPFGDGLVYVTPGGDNMSWFASDGADHFGTWKDTGLKLGSIFGNSRIQEIIDTKKYPQLAPIRFGGAEYRFIGFTENWNVYNPGVICEEGRFRMYYRGQEKSKISRLGYAESLDGVTFLCSPVPVVDATEPFEKTYGCEDPRIVKYQGVYYTFYTGNRNERSKQICLCEATSQDGIHWKKLGVIEAGTKNGAIVRDPAGTPIKINGKFVMYTGDSKFGVCYSDDLTTWSPITWIDLHLPAGWVTPYEPCVAIADHCASRPEDIVVFIAGTLNGKRKWYYAISEVLFSKSNLTRKAAQLDDCIMQPRESYESGTFKNCLWMNSLILHQGQWWMHYGAGDRNIGLATAPSKQ